MRERALSTLRITHEKLNQTEELAAVLRPAAPISAATLTPRAKGFRWLATGLSTAMSCAVYA